MYQSRCISIYLKAPLKMNLNPYLLFGRLRYCPDRRTWIQKVGNRMSGVVGGGTEKSTTMTEHKAEVR
jgi:hypothetical protein